MPGIRKEIEFNSNRTSLSSYPLYTNIFLHWQYIPLYKNYLSWLQNYVSLYRSYTHKKMYYSTSYSDLTIILFMYVQQCNDILKRKQKKKKKQGRNKAHLFDYRFLCVLQDCKHFPFVYYLYLAKEKKIRWEIQLILT